MNENALIALNNCQTLLLQLRHQIAEAQADIRGCVGGSIQEGYLEAVDMANYRIRGIETRVMEIEAVTRDYLIKQTDNCI